MPETKYRPGKKLTHVEALFMSLKPDEQTEGVFRALCEAKGIEKETIERRWGMVLATARRLFGNRKAAK